MKRMMASSSHLKPGSRVAIKVLVDARNRIGGRIVKTVEVFSNDPKKPRVILTLRAGM